MTRVWNRRHVKKQTHEEGVRVPQEGPLTMSLLMVSLPLSDNNLGSKPFAHASLRDS